MWKGKNGPCICFFCQNGKEHKHSIPITWRENGWLQVAESLDPKDIKRTRVCSICTHEEEV